MNHCMNPNGKSPKPVTNQRARTAALAATIFVSISAACMAAMFLGGQPTPTAGVTDAPITVKTTDATRWNKVAALARELLDTNDGFTIDIKKGADVGAVDAWAVSLKEAEVSFDEIPSEGDLVAYLTQNEHRFIASSDVHFGGWYDKTSGKWFLDLTKLIEDESDAIAFGIQQQQRCIFHLQTHQELWLTDKLQAVKSK